MSNMPAKLPNLMAFDEQHDSDSTYAKVKIYHTSKSKCSEKMKADDIQENRNWMQDNNHKKVDKQCYK